MFGVRLHLWPRSLLGAANHDARRRATPVNAIDGILAAFESHPIVALPDSHGSNQAHAFLLSLIRAPRFVQTVDDIVVEFGNARYQDVADRFLRGEDVRYESLRLVWRNHTQPSISADFTHYEDFFARADRERRDCRRAHAPGAAWRSPHRLGCRHE